MEKSLTEGERLLDASVVAGNWGLFEKSEGHAHNTADARIAVIGDKDVVGAFTALGFEMFPYTRDHKVRETIKDLAAKNYSLVLITESCAEGLADFLATFTTQPYPIILPIPDGVSVKRIGIGRIDANARRVNAAKGDS